MFQKDFLKFIWSSKRLRLLTFYMAATAFAPWYTIERLFQTETLHFTPIQIIWTINVALASGLILEIPSSILADRWSRSKTLALSMVFASLAGFVGSVSQELWHYVVVSFCWAVASALYSGTADALTYDILHEKGKSEYYAKTTAYFAQVFALSQIIASTIGGLLSHYVGFRYAYLAVLLLMPLAAVLIYRMQEPVFHKLGQASTSTRHLGRSLKRILTSKPILWLAVMLVVTNFIIMTPMFEFSALIMNDKGFGLVQLGIARAFTINGMVLLFGGLFAVLYPRARQLLVPALLFAGIFTYIATRPETSKVSFVLFFALAFIFQRAVSNWLQTALQHHFDSGERATTASVVSWAGGLVWIIVSIFVARRFESGGAASVYVLTAGITIAVAVLAALCLLLFFRGKKIFINEHHDRSNEGLVLLEQKT